MEIEFEKKSIESLRTAIKKFPNEVKSKVKYFLVRGMAVYRKGVISSPWRMGSGGGGSPVKTGNLRDMHRTEFSDFEARLIPETPYAPYVHGLNGQTINKRGVQLRPWLDYTMIAKDKEIKQLEKNLLDYITKTLT